MDKELRDQERAAKLDPEEIKAQEKVALAHWRSGKHMEAFSIFKQSNLGLHHDSAQALLKEMAAIQRPVLEKLPSNWRGQSLLNYSQAPASYTTATVKDILDSEAVLTQLSIEEKCSTQQERQIAELPFLQVLNVDGPDNLNLEILANAKDFHHLILGDVLEAEPQLSKIPQLRALSLRSKGFSESLSQQIAQLPLLWQLILQLTPGPQTCLENLEKCSSLKRFILVGVHLNSQDIVKPLKRVPIMALRLSFMSLCQESISALATQKTLSHLHLHRVQGLRGSQLSSLSELESLETLSLLSTDIQSYQLDFLPSLQNLTSLTLEGESIDQRALESISQLPQIETLSLASTRVGNRGLEALQKLDKLESFLVGNSYVTSDGMRLLVDLPNLARAQWGSHDYIRERDGTLTEFLDRVPPETEFFLPGAIGDDS